MKKYLVLLFTLTLCICLTACGGEGGDSNTPVVSNPPQNEQLSYETNKDGFITSCVLTIEGETFTYQCEGNNYLLIDDDLETILDIKESPEAAAGSFNEKKIYFHEGTAKVFLIEHCYLDPLGEPKTHHIEIFNTAGNLVVDRQMREAAGNFYFSLNYQPGPAVPLLNEIGEPILDSNGKWLTDDNAVEIVENVFEIRENGGILANARLNSTTYYDKETGKVIYEHIVNPDFAYVRRVYDRSTFQLTYEELCEDGTTVVKRVYNPDGSYSETVE
jgi:hypothetical protein